MPDASPDAVVTHHTDGYRSGVARFNEVLADRLGVPLLALPDLADAGAARPLLSFKVGEFDTASAAAVEAWLGDGRRFDVYLHALSGLELERRLIAGAERVFCGNSEIAGDELVRARSHELVWAPGLLEERAFPAADVTVFSFGMAHKLRPDMFRRLQRLLAETGRSYALYASAANHETASLRDTEVVFDELHEIFPNTLFFLGNLSDVAVHNRLLESTFFATFFERGARANNTSVAAALERGCVVITNLDEHSPRELVHMENVIDIEQCDALPLDEAVLRRISAAARTTASARSWQALVDRLRSPA